jgi:protoporphyrinogen oxidase
VIKVISDFVAEAHAPEREVKNYADWLLAGFGRTFAETFPMTYARKYHTTTADNMSTDWLGPRMYRPSLEEILRGALSASAPQKHYITHFRYPSEGGFMAYLKKFVPLGNLKLNHELTSVDPKKRLLTFANGAVAPYDGLVSSVPLPELIRMIPTAPPDVLAASQRLACTTCVLVNVGVSREQLSPGQITYFYDEDLSFTRLSFPHMLAASNVPKGTGSIQAEVYFSSKYKPLTVTPEDVIEPVIRDLRKVGLIKDGDEILFKGARLLRYANIIFDLERAEALKTVHAYLDEVGISYCGRYGDWGYMWTDESFISGERAAEQALTKLKASA